jgi:hypothetical protein
LKLGAGPDIYIANNSDSNNESYSNLGRTYQPQPGVTAETEQAKEHLAGSHKFKVKEIEVFQVQYLSSP